MPTTAAEYRRNHPRTKAVKMPSGAEFILQRPQPIAWGLSGALPSFFSEDVREAWNEARGFTPIPPERSTSAYENARQSRIMRALVRYSCVSPRMVEENPKEDEITFEELEAEDLSFLVKWAVSGAPEIAVSDEGVKLDELHTFRDERLRSESLSAGEDGRALLGAPV